MNYLAHLFLSGNNEEIIVGNFIGDFVKGQDTELYSEMIKKGIIVHRYIDSFTDSNMIVRLSKSRIKNKYHKYSGIIVDIFYDHFLILSWNNYSNYPLNDYVMHVHKILLKHMDVLPEEVKIIIPSFIKNNWINRYATIGGLKEVLNKMSDRTSLPDETAFAIEVLKSEYKNFETEFSTFFPTLIKYVSDTFDIEFSRDAYKETMK